MESELAVQLEQQVTERLAQAQESSLRQATSLRERHRYLGLTGCCCFSCNPATYSEHGFLYAFTFVNQDLSLSWEGYHQMLMDSQMSWGFSLTGSSP
jgi:hypothetical protein